MPSVTLDQVRTKEEALVQFLRDVLPEGKWGANDALRHLVVRAFAYILTSLEQERNTVLGMLTRDGLLAQDLVNDTGAIEMARAFLRSLAITQGEGTYAQGQVLFRTTGTSPVTVPANLGVTIGGQTFRCLYTEDRTINLEEMISVRDSQGVVIAYAFQVPVVAEETGASGNVEPGPVTGFDVFDPNVYSAEVTSSFQGGTDSTSLTEVLTNLDAYLGNDVLDNEPNIERAVRTAFPTVQQVDVVKAGDPLMARDLVYGQTPSLRCHAGGMADVYVTMSVVTQVLTPSAVVGGTFYLDTMVPTPASPYLFFYDAVVDFELSGVLPGDVLYLQTGWSGLQAYYVVERVWAHYLMVRLDTPFPVAMDNLTYSIGRRGPAYEDVVPGLGGVAPTTGETTGALQVPGAILLPTMPFLALKEVSFRDPASPLADPRTGRVYFTRQVNGAPQDPELVAAGEKEYRLTRLNPGAAHSSWGYTLLELGNYTPVAGQSLRVVAYVPDGFATVSSVVGETATRDCVLGNLLVRQKHPARVDLDLSYRLATGYTSVDEAAVRRFVANWVTQEVDNENLGLDDLAPAVRAAFPEVRTLLVDQAKTLLSLPEGEVVQYDGLVYDFDAATPELRFSGDVLPVPMPVPSEVGIGRRTVQFYSTEEWITLEVRA